MRESLLPVIIIVKIGILSHKLAACHALFVTVFLFQFGLLLLDISWLLDIFYLEVFHALIR